MEILTAAHSFPVFPCAAPDILRGVLAQDRRILLFGPPGIGKSTLMALLARELASAGRTCHVVSADPGSPAFGLPGAVSLAHWQAPGWEVGSFIGLCTLDAGRFRLPLVSAVGQLCQTVKTGVLLIDGPGIVRGMAGKEMLEGLVQAAQADAVLVLTASDRPLPLLAQLCALASDMFIVQAADVARRPGKRARARRRTRQWDSWLQDGVLQVVDLSKVNMVGLPLPRAEPAVWVGRQVTLLRKTTTLSMGEVVRLEGDKLTIRLPARVKEADTLIVRDAQRNTAGLLETAEPFVHEPLAYLPPSDMLASIQDSGGPRVVARVGSLDVALVNGVFGDPMLHLRLRHQGRSLLFDLGEGERLSARIAHQITDVFISHAHMDHIMAFLWLMRSRLGEFPPCRLYGPPGLVGHISGFMQGILWDRIGGNGPAFEVKELHGDQLKTARLQPGALEPRWQQALPVNQGVICEEPGFRIRAVELDHHTPVLAYAFESARQINIRKDKLQEKGLAPGPWLTELKRHLLADNQAAVITLPDGSQETVSALAAEVALVSSGKKLAYATDFADTEENRRRVIDLAWHAHTFFCEATFQEAERAQAIRTGHLTTHACGEIALAADVARLVPFHLSRRYADDPQPVYDEIYEVCDRVATPASLAVFPVEQPSVK